MQRHISLANDPAPTFVSATGGESRISNFLPWQFLHRIVFHSMLLAFLTDQSLNGRCKTTEASVTRLLLIT